MRFIVSPVAIILFILLIDLFVLWSTILPRKKRWLTATYCIIEAIPIIAYIIIASLARSMSSADQFYFISKLMTLAVTIVFPTFIYAIGDLISRIPILYHKTIWHNVRIGAIAIALLAFILCICGSINRKRLTVDNEVLTFTSLPDSFDGYRIVHVSDLHLGSFGSDTTYVASMVDRINSLKPDLVLFSGDIVTRHPDEMIPFIGTLSRLHATDGLYATLGNHDYCDYINYTDTLQRSVDRLKLRQLYTSTPFILLNDSTATISRGNDTIYISGTENIGQPPFPAYGSIERATADKPKGDFGILITHDPMAWQPDSLDYQLTLSGHTHSMQFNLFGISPARLMHKRYEGIYQEGDKMLNINRGIGTVGVLMRIGATPQISLLELYSAQK